MTALGLHHHLLLFDLDDATGRPRAWDPVLRDCALAGALAAELQLRERLVAVKADRFAVRQGAPPGSGALGHAESHLAGRRPLLLSRILGLLANRTRRLRRATLDELVDAGILRMERDRLWLVPYRTRWPAADRAVKRGVIDALRRWIDGGSADAPPGREDLLLSLLRACKALDAVWAPDELARVRDRVERRTDMAPIGRHVVTLARHIQAAAAAAAAMG